MIIAHTVCNIQAAVLAMDESIVNVDQIGNLIKFCPTKEEMELLKVTTPFFLCNSDGHRGYDHSLVIDTSSCYCCNLIGFVELPW